MGIALPSVPSVYDLPIFSFLFNEIRKMAKNKVGTETAKLGTVEPNFGKVDRNQPETAYPSVDWSNFERKARVVETALRLYGKKAARRLWSDLGLPEVPGFPRTRPDAALLANVGAFVDACMVRDDHGQLSAIEAHAAYCRWAVARGADRLTLAMFGRLMNHSAIPKRHRRHVTYAARLVGELPGTPSFASGRDVKR